MFFICSNAWDMYDTIDWRWMFGMGWGIGGWRGGDNS